MIGKSIFNYKIISVLGEGGMSTVYLGEHEQLGTKAAIKILDNKLAKKEDLKERFRNEAKLLAQLNHPNIVSLLNYDESDDGLVIIMDYAEGLPINTYVLQYDLSEEQIAALFLPVLDAFQFAHQQGIIHRDIKPDNILVSKDGVPHVLDFGIAKILELDMTQYTQQLGTPTYMSPEQIKDSTELDGRSDVYSLGTTLYELITRRKPFKADSGSMFEIMSKVVNEPLPLTQSRLDVVIQKATAKSAAERYNDCSTFKSDIMNTLKSNDVKTPVVTTAKVNIADGVKDVFWNLPAVLTLFNIVTFGGLVFINDPLIHGAKPFGEVFLFTGAMALFIIGFSKPHFRKSTFIVGNAIIALSYLIFILSGIVNTLLLENSPELSVSFFSLIGSILLNYTAHAFGASLCAFTCALLGIHIVIQKSDDESVKKLNMAALIFSILLVMYGFWAALQGNWIDITGRYL